MANTLEELETLNPICGMCKDTFDYSGLIVIHNINDKTKPKYSLACDKCFEKIEEDEEDEEDEDEWFDRKYPNASCFRCDTKLNAKSVVFCGGGGDCETWYCAECHQEGTDDCDVCKAMNEGEEHNIEDCEEDDCKECHKGIYCDCCDNHCPHCNHK